MLLRGNQQDRAYGGWMEQKPERWTTIVDGLTSIERAIERMRLDHPQIL